MSVTLKVLLVALLLCFWLALDYLQINDSTLKGLVYTLAVGLGVDHISRKDDKP